MPVLNASNLRHRKVNVPLSPQDILHTKHAPRLEWGEADCRNLVLKWNGEIRSSKKEQRLLTDLHARKPVNMQIDRHFYWEFTCFWFLANYFKPTKTHCIQASYTTPTGHRAGQFTLTLFRGMLRYFWGRKFGSTLNITVLKNHFGHLSFTTLMWKYTKDSTLSCKTPWQSCLGKELLAQKMKQWILQKISERGENKGCLDCASL